MRSRLRTPSSPSGCRAGASCHGADWQFRHLGQQRVSPSRLRRPAGPIGKAAKSDRVSTTYAGLRVDKPYAQQRFLLDLTGTTYRYDNFSFLDFNALRYQGRGSGTSPLA